MNLRQIERAIEAERTAIVDAKVAIARSEARLIALEELRRLHSGNSGSTVAIRMETDHRLAISASRSSAKDKRFVGAARTAGYSTTTLAAALGIHKSALSRYRSGLRETPMAVASRVAELIGWPADSKHWPKLGS